MRIKEIVMKGSGARIEIAENDVVDVVVRPVYQYGLEGDDVFSIIDTEYKSYLSIRGKSQSMEVLESEIAIIIREEDEE